MTKHMGGTRMGQDRTTDDSQSTVSSHAENGSSYAGHANARESKNGCAAAVRDVIDQQRRRCEGVGRGRRERRVVVAVPLELVHAACQTDTRAGVVLACVLIKAIHEAFVQAQQRIDHVVERIVVLPPPGVDESVVEWLQAAAVAWMHDMPFDQAVTRHKRHAKPLVEKQAEADSGKSAKLTTRFVLHHINRRCAVVVVISSLAENNQLLETRDDVALVRYVTGMDALGSSVRGPILIANGW